MDEVYAWYKSVVYFFIFICDCSNYCEAIFFEKIIAYFINPYIISAAFLEASPPDANSFFNVA